MDNLLSQLRGMGLRLALRDEFTVRAGPKSMLNDNTRALIWSRKDELLALLKAELPLCKRLKGHHPIRAIIAIRCAPISFGCRRYFGLSLLFSPF